MNQAKDVFQEFSNLFDGVLGNIGLMTGSVVISQPNDQQTVYEAFSNVCYIGWEIYLKQGIAK